MTACGDFANDALVGDDGRYLGDFRETFDPSPPQDRRMGVARWPVGWTGNGQFVGPTYETGWFGAGIPIFTASPTGLKRLTVVNDTSGPTGLEAVAAAEMLFTGSSGSGMTFMGEGPAFESGWTISPGDCWYAQCWAKAVPDPDGFTATGWNFDMKGADPANVANNLGVTSWDTGTTLSSSWSFFAGRIQWPSTGFSTFVNGQFAIYTLTDNGGIPKGAIHVKCPHLYPCNTPPGGPTIYRVGVTNLAGA